MVAYHFNTTALNDFIYKTPEIIKQLHADWE